MNQKTKELLLSIFKVNFDILNDTIEDTFKVLKEHCFIEDKIDIDKTYKSFRKDLLALNKIIEAFESETN